MDHRASKDLKVSRASRENRVFRGLQAPRGNVGHRASKGLKVSGASRENQESRVHRGLRERPDRQGRSAVSPNRTSSLSCTLTTR